MFKSRNDLGLLEVSGDDRAKYLHNMLSNDFKNFSSGRVQLASMLSHKGRLLAFMRAIAWPDRIWLEVEAEQAGEVLEHLQKFVVASKVTLRNLSQEYSIISSLGEPLLKVGSEECAIESLDGISCHVARWKEPVDPTFSLIVAKSDEAKVQKWLLAQGSKPMSDADWSVLRIEAGMPRFGTDITGENLLLEVPYLTRGVSYNKGCYVGQETVARLAARGSNVARRLMGVVSEKELPANAEVVWQDKTVGHLSSVCFSTRLQKPLSLALIHRDAFEPGTEVTVRSDEGTAPGRVITLPLEAPPVDSHTRSENLKR